MRTGRVQAAEALDTKRQRHRVRSALAGFAALPFTVGATLGGTQLVASAAPAADNGLLSAGECAANRAAGTINWASPFGFASSSTILDVFAAQGLGYFKDMCLNVKFITNSYTSQNLVSTDAAQITGQGSAADYLLAVANGANLQAIATDGDRSNYAILTQASINSLKQLTGKSFGYHQTVPVVASEMLAKAGVIKHIAFIDDNSYDPTLLTQGKFDAIQAFQSNEPQLLRADNLKFNEFTPSQFGVKGTVGVTVVNGTFLKDHPSAAKDWLRADLKAFSYCISNAAKCLQIEEKAAKSSGVTFAYQHELVRWKIESGIAVNAELPGKGIGVETNAEWTPEAHALLTYGLVKKAPSLGTYENTTLAASLYQGKKLVWP